ncbi:hypothetical protein LSUE1_G009116 [Lachnellula suecica]|uniref:NmrA-like domain-containing protein n=1 Tax=Lachnellula suecica TaxID=602035 RepID=A0A8T9BR37_9HELO|nr:hypothetical protein LSUE1_G009116 [Lachnellula suecica]
MGKIAVAGGSGAVGQEIVKVLAASRRHEILILSRSDVSDKGESRPGVTWVKADYGDMASVLSAVDTVLSFIATHADPGSTVQKTLIDASIIAGVKRFAPSEWATSNFEELPWYAEKANIRAYLQEINKEKKPGAAIDQLAIENFEFVFDLKSRRAIVLDGYDSVITLTTYGDLANIVLRAVEYEGKWPVNGGVQGTTIATSKFLEIAARVRGKPFEIQALKEEDLRADIIKSSWIPRLEIPGLPDEQVDAFSKMVLKGWLLSGLHESWRVSDEWNRLLPDYKFTDAEEFLTKAWAGKP